MNRQETPAQKLEAAFHQHIARLLSKKLQGYVMGAFREVIAMPEHVPTQVPSVWILTEEYNEYDQHGEYFVAVWANKPTIEQLRERIPRNDEQLEHILNGGGRKGVEDHWYYLTVQGV
jgi:hypothetical protein